MERQCGCRPRHKAYTMRRATLRITSTLIAFTLLAACSVNPVTGKNELMLVGEGTELQIGQKNFAPMRQAEGGDQRLDPGLTAYVQGVGQRREDRGSRGRSRDWYDRDGHQQRRRVGLH